ncbi:MAG: hypothetical protein NC041_05400 [Bacteroides sp.]|nr:hypothetical protein [Prevotella sp.]MCM1407392.1 hypothetical protein [Treponema brennaborense]MCM1469882.1 hypothetical protein [Bacteroides sp.]
MTENSSGSQEIWYALPGADNDVVLSTRVRLARNLANFQFPNKFRTDDAERVRTLVFEAFSRLHNASGYQSLPVSELEPLGRRILTERGIISPDSISCPMAGITVKTDGHISCAVNCLDHLRIASFAAGCSPETAFAAAHEVDIALQNYLQFAASADFGFLTASLRALGTGMKISFLLHLSSASAAGQLERIFKELMARNYAITGFYGTNSGKGKSAGAYYLVSSASSFAGSEESQIADMLSAMKSCIEFERKLRRELAENKPTAVFDVVCRAIAIIKYSRLMGLQEGIDLISKVKWGKDLGLVTGIDDADLLALQYRIQNAHLQFVLRTSKLKYEKDITTDDLRIERLRTLVIQNALSDIRLVA